MPPCPSLQFDRLDESLHCLARLHSAPTPQCPRGLNRCFRDFRSRSRMLVSLKPSYVSDFRPRRVNRIVWGGV
jgi:hypothetical protein